MKYTQDRKFYIASKHQKEIDSKINKEIKKKYNIQTNNRKYIIDALLKSIQGTNEKLLDATAFTIVKFDIEKFFDSVNTHLLYKRINRSNMLEDRSLTKIKEIVFSPSIKGLPQGVSFSSALADIYLEDFDRIIPNVLPNVLLYERFVDDVIIVLYGDHKSSEDKIRGTISELLSKNNLRIKSSKTEISLVRKSLSCKGKDKCQKCKVNQKCEINTFDFNFSYLGYIFSHDETNGEKIRIGVHSNKVEKCLGKIRSFFSAYYYSNHTSKDFYKLFYSLRNLLWRVQTKKYETNSNLNFGFIYNYTRINSYESLLEINGELSKQIKRCKYLNDLNREQLGTLYIYPNNLKKYYFNYNKASRKQLIEICNNLSLNNLVNKSRDELTRAIFSCLYK